MTSGRPRRHGRPRHKRAADSAPMRWWRLSAAVLTTALAGGAMARPAADSPVGRADDLKQHIGLQAAVERVRKQLAPAVATTPAPPTALGTQSTAQSTPTSCTTIVQTLTLIEESDLVSTKGKERILSIDSAAFKDNILAHLQTELGPLLGGTSLTERIRSVTIDSQEIVSDQPGFGYVLHVIMIRYTVRDAADLNATELQTATAQALSPASGQALRLDDSFVFGAGDGVTTDRIAADCNDVGATSDSSGDGTNVPLIVGLVLGGGTMAALLGVWLFCNRSRRPSPDASTSDPDQKRPRSTGNDNYRHDDAEDPVTGSMGI
eukprot:CAMPEP_0182927258 /NCGR_PEP_ID=MMETSP0105_2-20130417/13688_1 /TAXON_ID=81532 ORGANISM="Acanthoeca-like sp., Strain 10tr" /NCGR_SAMPLE_ID=MMETSP0105_2 /ASSEMBLY_ACC=CAM_ASM_000205 /LENGTH=320 /DNA_ID=CAMNT_0025065201 /DNA_START=351 /DNA_END=1313 /DNA_ORIENTATION=+